MHTNAWTPILALMLQVGLIIALARILAWSMRRWHQPAVIAEILAGIALGPSLLGWFWPEAMSAVFRPESLPLLSTVSEFGLVLFMFLVGLEFDPRLIRGRGRISAVISTVGIVVPFGLGAALAGFMFPAYAGPGADFTPFALFMGAAMSVTAFPVLARILAERRLVQSRVGAISLASAAVGDVAAWCILAFVISIARAEGVTGAIVTTVLSAVYIVVMMTVVRPLLQRLDSRAGEVASQNLLAAATLLLLLSATITELIGIHALFGGFLLGAVMPREGGLAKTLVARMEDLIVVVILPLFFAYSGLRTEVGLIGSTQDILACAAVIVVALLGKFGGTAAAARLVGLSGRESGAIGVLMNTRGLMELIVLNIGLDLGVLSPQMFTIMVIMALVTTVMASPLLEWIYPRSKMTVDPALAGARQRPAALLCISDQSIARAMVVLGASLVKRGQDLAALHVLPADRPSVYMRATGEGGRERLLDRVQALGKSLEVEIRPIPAVSDDPGSTILEIAAAEGPELVLLGAHRPVLGRSPFGGVVQEIQRKANFPTGLLVDNGLAQLGRVLVVAARSRSGELAADLARRMAEADSLELTRIDLGPDYSVLRSSDQPPRRIDGDAVGKAAFSRLREFGPVSVLAKYDLVIVPMDLGGPAEAGRPSAVLEAMVRECPTSVLVIQSA